MKISIVQGAFLPVPPLRGGAIEKAFYELAHEFASLGHFVYYQSRLCDGLLQKEEESQNLTHYRTQGFDAPSSTFLYKIYDFMYSWKVLRCLPSADILITHTFWLPILAQNLYGHGKVYVHVGRVPKGQMKLYKNVSRLQTVSSPIVDKIKSELPPDRHSRVSLIPYPLSEEFTRPVRDDLRSKTLLYAGRIHPEKGINILIKAYLQIPGLSRSDWKLKIVGPWEARHGGGGKIYLDELKTFSKGEPSIEFQDPVFDQSMLVEEFDSASIFVYPSIAEKGETFGLAALEAMSRECVTVVSSLACFRDFIEPGINGYIFDHRVELPELTLATMLEGIIMSHGNQHNMSIRKNGFKTARNYTVQNVATQFLDDFESIVGCEN